MAEQLNTIYRITFPLIHPPKSRMRQNGDGTRSVRDVRDVIHIKSLPIHPKTAAVAPISRILLLLTITVFIVILEL